MSILALVRSSAWLSLVGARCSPKLFVVVVVVGSVVAIGAEGLLRFRSQRRWEQIDLTLKKV